MAVPDDALQRYPPLPYYEIKRLARTGDLILCSGRTPFSRMIRWATGSPWSHVALVARVDALDRVMVLESVERTGVRAVALRSFISHGSSGRRPFPGRLLLIRHREFEHQATPKRLIAMADFAVDRFGAPFSFREVVRIATRILLGAIKVRMPGRLNPRTEYICSEYVGKCYERIGIQIPWDGRGFIAPCDFARDPDIEVVAQIDPSIERPDKHA
ncbi:MAG: hypothetical protein WA840_11700 [Caulobacteraceae bacterium]